MVNEEHEGLYPLTRMELGNVLGTEILAMHLEAKNPQNEGLVDMFRCVLDAEQATTLGTRLLFLVQEFEQRVSNE